MIFSPKTIIDEDTLSLSEKKALMDKFFPKVDPPPWKKKLLDFQKELERREVWNAYVGKEEYEGEISSYPYRYTTKTLERLAVGKIPEDPGNRVTDFTGWLMSLYLGKPRNSALQHGKATERRVARYLEPLENSGYSLVYKDPLDRKPDALKISALTINGEPLWGAPDLVYQHDVTKEIIIVERKASDKAIPTDGWPNLRAQLWAYSKADLWINAPKITLIGEVWQMMRYQVFRRGILRWSSDDPAIEESNSKLFELYGGKIRGDIKENHYQEAS